MLNQSLTAKRIFLNAYLILIVSLTLLGTNIAVAQSDYDAQRRRALDLWDQNKFADAVPLLEDLVKTKTDDSVLWERLGWATMVVSDSIKDPDLRAQGRARALAAFKRAQQLGDDSNLLKMGLEHLSAPDVADTAFSRNSAADAAMREGEEAHSRGDLNKALAKYARAFELDPKLYLAALLAGDMEFKKGHNATEPKARSDAFDRAATWFAKAIAVDPNRETAYRYWGDALDMQGNTEAARDKFVEAIVAEPYSRTPYVGLTQWADRHQVSLGHPRIDIPSNVTSNKPGEVNITIDDLALKSNDDGSAAWMMYGIARAGWMNQKDGKRSEKFAKAYPEEASYRHSLAEETDALRLVVESLQTQIKDNRIKKLTPSLENLVRLHEAGLLEPYILFVRPDKGIAQDYSSYRAVNREKLRRYWNEVVIIH